MSAAVIDSPQNEQAQAWWFLDLLVIEHRCAPGMETVVLEMTLPVGSSPPLLVHDNASVRDLIRELGVPAEAHVVPAQPVFPSRDQLARVASSHDLMVIGPPMSVEEADAIFAAAH